MKRKLEKINDILRQFFGVPAKAAVPPDPVDLIIATILSQNTNDKNSYKAFRLLKQKYPEWITVHKLKTERLEDIIRIAGLSKQKAAAIKDLLDYLVNTKGTVSLDYTEQLSNDEILQELTSIKGIGIKTASCVLLFSLERNVCPVDTHVHRVLNRVGIVKTATPEKTFIMIRNEIPENSAHQFHTNLIRLGREICKSSGPVCYICPLKKLCRYPEKDFSRKVKGRENSFFLLDNIDSLAN